MGNEPEKYFEELLGSGHEGLGYSEYLVDSVPETLPKIQFLIREALEHHKRPRARRKQNESLEETIQRLAQVFQRYTVRNPMETHRYDELDEEQPYKSDFFSFMYAFFWVDEDRKPRLRRPSATRHCACLALKNRDVINGQILSHI
ncbi:hypothetical protein [uncultured Ruegeria sp.]|uniref:hypothetical protein n=1 Tax=uncultured Ruegeria sp. TaxID=259304 RepID=UPI002631A6F1|nr:hypothetical protein [uncultured Ruegeria sp.]